MFLRFYSHLVLQRAPLVIFLLSLVTVCLLYFTRDFRLDASSDSLVVEGDADLEYSRQINERYGAGDFVLVSYTPQESLFSASSLTRLQSLKEELAAFERVESVDSLLDVPLFKVAGVGLSDVAGNIITLSSPEVDLEAARQDLMSNETYRNILLSEDGKTASLIVNFVINPELRRLLKQRTELRDLARQSSLTAAQQQNLKEVERAYLRLNEQASVELHQDISAIRQVLNRYRGDATIYMGGVPMIADDLISFVKNDLLTFGLAIFVFIVLSLSYLFRKLRYVLIPLLCCLTTGIAVIGFLGLFEWPVTVVSSNFISLLLIITISLTVHLMVRYKELEADIPGAEHKELLRLTLASMFKPCAYTSLTTIVAFGSLVVSEIPPIIDFGWMMVLGVFMTFFITFNLFPALLSRLRKNQAKPVRGSIDLTPLLASFTERHGMKILVFSLFLAVFSALGIGRLKVENSFIDYFDQDTEIYQGMVAIDRQLGGTTPLEVIVDLRQAAPGGDEGWDPGFDDEAGWEEPAWEEESWEEEGDEDAYWFTREKMQRVVAIHDYLDGLPETGKVMSLGTMLKLAYELNDGEELNSIELGVLYTKIPEAYKESLLKPYVSVENDQLRYNVRIRESDPNLVREELLAKIRQGLMNEFDLNEDQVHLTGMLVLYNNMLQSLFESQILTLGLVLAVIMVMFMILFRSFKLALIGIIPNMLAASTVLGLMGWLNIPLDMMTITIAAISIGIGVDNTIHYIHRFKSNFGKYGDYRKTMHYCHGSIGKAMYYTSFTIVVGFSILVLSNFVPTVYFGILTSIAMVLALMGALTLLPQLLIIFKPLGKP